MSRRSSTWQPVQRLLLMVLATTVLAGCVGDTPDPPSPPGPVADAAPEPQVTSDGRPVAVTTDEILDLSAWVVDLGEVTAEPDASRQMQLAHVETAFGALRLLSDGAAFVVLVDDTRVPLDAGVVALARVAAADGGGTVARGVAMVGGGDRVAVPLESHDAIRFGAGYTFDVLVLRPEANVTDLLDEAVAAARDDLGVNATLVHRWTGPVLRSAAYSMELTGPDTGTDRRNELERPLTGGTDTGRYEVTLEGERIWLVTLDADLGPSRLHASEPQLAVNDTNTFSLDFEGYAPISTYRAMLPDQGIRQSFRLVFWVDHETSDDLPSEQQVRYLVHAGVAERMGRETLTAATPSMWVDVRVTNEGV